MQRAPILSLTAALLLVALTGCANPADDKPAAVVDEATTVPETAGGERFAILADSEIAFVGSKVTGSHDGGFRTFEGEIRIVDGKPELSSVSVVIDTTSLWSDHEKLTGHLKSPDFFDVENFPTATFESTKIEPMADHYMLSGNLDLHGITKQVTFPATIAVEGDRVTAQAEFSIMRFDFDIVYPGKTDDLIRDEVVIRLNLVAGREQEEAAEAA